MGCQYNLDSDCSASCGNGMLEQGETCDPPDTCPSECETGDPCAIGLLTGSPDTCNSTCVFTEIHGCGHGDGCCPNGCGLADDDDCDEICGNGRVERGET